MGFVLRLVWNITTPCVDQIQTLWRYAWQYVCLPLDFKGLTGHQRV